MAAEAPAQYDGIADAYSTLYPPNFNPSPFLHARLEEEQFKRAFESPAMSLNGKRVLDLAGKNGHYSFRWLAWGAASVVNCDISEAMSRRGRIAAAEQAVPDSRLRFLVADAVAPHLDVEGAPFDMVTAAWLLNYAPDFETLERMWTNIGRQLRPGGVFVGLLPPPLLTDLPFEKDLLEAVLSAEGVWGRYGTGGNVLEKTSTGYKVLTRLGVSGQCGEAVCFENFHVRKEMLEDAFGRTGLFGGLEWRDWVTSDELRKEYPDLADDATLLPHCRSDFKDTRSSHLELALISCSDCDSCAAHDNSLYADDARAMFLQEFVGYDVVKTIVIVIATISLVVFVALFGRLPVFRPNRRTPIAFLHKLLTKHIPNGFVWVDSYLTGRRLSRALFSTGHYLMYEKHPIVLIFFVLLQTLGELSLVPQIWATISIFHKLLIPITIFLPHYFLYLTATTSPIIPLAPNVHPHYTPPSPTTSTTPPTQLHFGPAHATAMHAYPYDYLLYHPGYFCSTCRFPKPARSKHCSLCKACIEKQDHHCIWVNNCVGRRNYGYFLALLVTITALLIYGVHLGWRDMAARLAGRFAPPGSAEGRSWATDTSWSLWFDRLAWAMVVDVRVGATTLLCAMCTPLGGAFLVYHAYLLWAGMTTNEQGKWADWKEDVRDEVVFRAEIGELRKSLGEGERDGDAGDGGFRRGHGPAGEQQQQLEVGAYPPLPREIEPPADAVDWPPRRIPASLWQPADGVAAAHRPRWWYIRTRHGDQPVVKMGAAEAKRKGLRVEGYPGGDENGVGSVGGRAAEVEVQVEDMRWRRVLSMRREMDNIYDLGMWGNLMEVIYHRD